MTKKRILVAAMAVFAMLLSVSACDKAAALGPLKKQGMKLIAEHAGKLGSLKGLLGPMLSKANAIPDSIPGAAALKKALAGSEDKIGGISKLLASAPAQIEEAAKSGKKEGITNIIGQLKEAGTGLSTIEKTLSDSESKLGDLTKLAAAAKASELAGAAGLDWAKTLSTGYELKGAATGIESMLITFLEDSTIEVDKATWFNFDRLTFATASANLDMDKSKAQLTNMSEIMKAYPESTLKLGGYTDNTGDPKKNVELSQKRADSVKAALIGMGMKAERIEAEGYGQAHPVCEANDTPECKAKNRRIAVNITHK